MRAHFECPKTLWPDGFEALSIRGPGPAHTVPSLVQRPPGNEKPGVDLLRGCMYVYVCVCVCVCVCVWVYLYVCAFVEMYTHVFMCMYIRYACLFLRGELPEIRSPVTCFHKFAFVLVDSCALSLSY